VQRPGDAERDKDNAAPDVQRTFQIN